ncbi:MAG: hexosyltransferase, partial [Planctomycetaceae bacterium]|nr:hexosyltransferase [Planctomycetaceae bacterium]
MHIAFVTAGGAGMFCGSCMQDNALAKALIRCGAEVSLIPTYTPIRVDDQDFTTDQVYLGGINLYLDERIPFWRWMPRSLVSWLDHPKVIKWATRYGVSNDAANLGPMTLAMLAGGNGPMAREYEQFAQHLVSDLKPDAIIFSNALLSGAMPMIRERFSGPVLCMIQGDDIFLDQLPESFRSEAIRTIHDHSRTFSAFVTHTRFYAGMMAEYLGIAPEKFQQIPLSVDLDAIDVALGQIPKKQAASRKQIGYFARIAPEKGLL